MMTESPDLDEIQDVYLDSFTQAYAEATLWANTTLVRNGEPTEEPVEPAWWQAPRRLWAVEAFDSDAQASIREDCGDFVRANWSDLKDLDPSQAGHDFALTRNHHGAGFWDRGLGEVGERLTQACRPYGDSDAWFDDDAEDSHVHLH